jgi:hypothetical protein
VLTALIIISPIAFVLYLLPNTEKWFKKWWTEFTRMLFVFPMIAGVWGLAKFMMSVTNDVSDDQNIFQSISGYFIKLLLMIAPAVAIIPIMKMGGQAMGAITKGLRAAADKTGASQSAKKRDEVRRGTVKAGTPLRNIGGKTALREDRLKAMQAANKAAYGNKKGRFGNRFGGPQGIQQRAMAEQSREQLAKSEAVTGYATAIMENDGKNKHTKGLSEQQTSQMKAQAQKTLDDQTNKEIEAHGTLIADLNIDQLKEKLREAHNDVERAATIKAIAKKGTANDVFQAYGTAQGMNEPQAKAAKTAALSALAGHESVSQIPGLGAAMNRGEDLSGAVNTGLQSLDASKLSSMTPETLAGLAEQTEISRGSMDHLMDIAQERQRNPNMANVSQGMASQLDIMHATRNVNDRPKP